MTTKRKKKWHGFDSPRKLGRAAGRDQEGFAENDDCGTPVRTLVKNIAADFESALGARRSTSIDKDVAGMSRAQRREYFSGFRAGLAKTIQVGRKRSFGCTR